MLVATFAEFAAIGFPDRGGDYAFSEIDVTSINGLSACFKAKFFGIFQVSTGGGEEDQHDLSGSPNNKLYSPTDDVAAVVLAQAPINRFLFAASTGIVHRVHLTSTD